MLRTLSDNEIHVWTAFEADFDAASEDRVASLLSGGERARLDALRFVKDKRQFALAHGLLRMALSEYADRQPVEWEFGANELGKPVLAGNDTLKLFFNLSHTEGLSACAVARVETVGIDVERICDAADLTELATQYFSHAEADSVIQAAADKRAATYFEHWTRKEAYLKAIGTGLRAEKAGAANGGYPCHSASNWQFARMHLGTEYAGVVAVHSDQPILYEISRYDGRRLFEHPRREIERIKV